MKSFLLMLSQEAEHKRHATYSVLYTKVHKKDVEYVSSKAKNFILSIFY